MFTDQEGNLRSSGGRWNTRLFYSIRNENVSDHSKENVDENNYGLGVWNNEVQQFSGEYYGDSLFVGSSYDLPTAYIAPNSIDILDYNITYGYSYSLPCSWSGRGNQGLCV